MPSIWDTEITYLKKVGPKRAEILLKEAQIATFGDLLHYFPRKYVDRSQVSQVRELTGEEQTVTLVGKITRVDANKTRKGRSRLKALFSDGTGTIELVWFQGVRWMTDKLRVGEEVALFGRPNLYNGRVNIAHPEIDWINRDQGSRKTGQIVPFYPSTEKLGRVGLDARGFREITQILLDQYASGIQEILPEQVLKKYGLMDRQKAFRQVHFPESFDLLKAARFRLVFEEFFFFQLMMARRKELMRSSHKAAPFTEVGDYFNSFFANHMPFELTGAQKRVIRELRRDMGRPVQMNRLVQGDVGSGKTMVAFMSMLLAKDNGFQSAFMAPTAILAEQHMRKLSVLAEKVGMRCALLVGGQGKKLRKEILGDLASGEIDITIGTHALIEDPVRFKNLGLVIIDEQHKFGVLQRAKLWKKANPYPHNMIMTATPIPRTLAMSLYGDVDVSVIDELPPGRQPIKTTVHGESKRLEIFGFIRSQLQQGRQAYVVYPLVEESDKLDYLAAVEGYEKLERAFPNFRVGIVHGRMKPEDKDFEMRRFVKNEIQILVSTTVIEVGVDVPNSTIMVIENAEKFGLSQLHQLRGRVGRGANQSFCILMTGNKLSAEARTRLRAMVETQDGFRIAEIDLDLRGPGDFLGTRQSGLPDFKLASLGTDQQVLQLAREAAFDLAGNDPDLEKPENQVMKAFFMNYLKQNAALAAVA